MWSRRIELVCGALGGALGLALLGVWLFAPVCAGAEIGCVPGTLWGFWGLASLSFPITVVGGLSVGIVVFALWHGLTRSPWALLLLWVCTTLLGVACITTNMTLSGCECVIRQPPHGIFLYGSGALFVLLRLVPVAALVASIAGTVAAWQRVPAQG